MVKTKLQFLIVLFKAVAGWLVFAIGVDLRTS